MEKPVFWVKQVSTLFFEMKWINVYVVLVKITRDSTKLTVTADAPFSKRYLKYLSKKYLKKQQLRDYLRVISTNKTTYTLKYLNVDAGADAGDDEEEEDDE